MLNIRTAILSVLLIVLLVLSVGIVTARTETNSNSSSDEANLSQIQEQSVEANKTYNVLSYRSQLGECFDVSIQELDNCQDHAQPTAQTYRPRLDGCFDVPIREIASCQNENQTSAP